MFALPGGVWVASIVGWFTWLGYLRWFADFRVSWVLYLSLQAAFVGFDWLFLLLSFACWLC